MFIYIEKQVKSLDITRNIVSRFSNPTIIEIDHYKNIFDKNIWNNKLEKSIILAKSSFKIIVITNKQVANLFI